jgi:CHAT domain-containing protein/Tfp pilus assembly protein PilF
MSSAAVTSLGSSAEQGSDTAIALQTANGEVSQAEIRELKQGQVIERELAGGEAHTYRITLASGQYLKAGVEQKGIDVVVRLFGSDSKRLAEVDSYPQIGSESVLVIAGASGEYRLEVRSQNKEVATGRYEIKIEELREATSRDRTRVAATMAYLEGEQLRDQGTADAWRKVIEKCDEALTLYRALDDRQGEGNALNLMGLAHSRLGEIERALDHYRQAASLFQAVGSRWDEAQTLSNIGVAYWRLGQLQKALEYNALALPLVRTIGDREVESDILNTTGVIHKDLGEPKEALEYLNRALLLKRAIGERRGEAVALNNIGSAYQNLGEHQKALELFAQALSVRRAIGDGRGEAVTLSNIGNSYRALGDPQKALEYYTQALSLGRAAGDRRGEAYTLSNLGNSYMALGELQKALEHHLQALSLRRAVADRYGEAYTLSQIGTVYSKLGEPEKAIEFHQQALLLNRDTGDRQGEAYTLSNIGEGYLALGNPQKALEHCRQALQLIRNVGNWVDEAQILQRIALAHRDLGNLIEARDQIQAALDVLESFRIKLASQESRTSFLASKQDYYELNIDVLMRLHQRQPSAGHDAAALQSSEQARARSLLEILTEAHADIRQGVDTVLLERERSLQQQLSVKAELLTRLLGGKHTKDQEAASTKEVEAILSEYQEIEAQIRTKSPRYAALTQPQPLTLKEIQQMLDEDTLLLEYALGKDRSYLWAVTPTSIKSYELPKRTEIEAAGRHVYDLLVANADALYPEALLTLSRMLLKPVAEQLGRKRLVIVPEGTLQYVPFGALPAPSAQGSGVSGRRAWISKDRSFQPLIVNHEIVSLPSASVLAALRLELGTRNSAPKTLAVLADPVFDKDDQRVRSKVKSQQVDEQSGKKKETDQTSPPLDVERSIKESGLNSFDRLLLSRREAELITALASNGRPFKALDFTASRVTATNPELDQYQIVHFATHSLLNNQHPELSGIVLSLVDEQGQPQDGFLRLYEIYNLKLNADLVVLSACQTALGKEIKGEGLVGLTRGFMYAGAPRVVASLWKVSDKATTELMKRFYEKMLRDGLRPAAALRAAQVSMLKEKRWEAAYYWAGFVLQGEWR